MGMSASIHHTLTPCRCTAAACVNDGHRGGCTWQGPTSTSPICCWCVPLPCACMQHWCRCCDMQPSTAGSNKLMCNTRGYLMCLGLQWEHLPAQWMPTLNGAMSTVLAIRLSSGARPRTSARDVHDATRGMVTQCFTCVGECRICSGSFAAMTQRNEAFERECVAIVPTCSLCIDAARLELRA